MAYRIRPVILDTTMNMTKNQQNLHVDSVISFFSFGHKYGLNYVLSTGITLLMLDNYESVVKACHI